MSKETEMLEEAKELYLKCRLDDAFLLFKKSASKGNPEAMYFLGEYISQGYGHVARDIKKGYEWRKKGAAGGNILCELNLAYLPELSEKKRQAICQKLFPKIVKMSEAGDIFAQNELADMYLYGFGTEADLDVGIYWLRKATERGFWRPMNKLGEVYWDRSTSYFDLKKAREYLKKAADMGYSTAEMNLAVMYCFEKPRRMDLCIQYAKRSYAHGGEAASEAAAFLDEIYSFSGFVPKNPIEGLAWVKRSVDMGSGRGMRNMGTHYRDGLGVSQNHEKAMEWYKKSADTGYVNGMVAYGIALRRSGECEKSAKYFEKAAQLEDSIGMVWYASCFLYGYGTVKNTEIAEFWLKRAADYGNRDAKILLKGELGIKYPEKGD